MALLNFSAAKISASLDVFHQIGTIQNQCRDGYPEIPALVNE